MSNTRGFYDFNDGFHGARTYSATAASNVGHGYLIADTSAAGTPTYVSVDGSANGEIAIDLEATAEVQNVCLHQADILQFDIDNITEAYFRVKMNQAALDTTTMVAFGLTGDRNDAIDTIAQSAIFRVVGADSTTNIVVETDDHVILFLVDSSKISQVEKLFAVGFGFFS